jgi:hypothetical protein
VRLRDFEGRRSGYANVTSTLALVLALGGTSYAATQLRPHSVGTKQLKTGAVTAPKIANGAVHARALAPRSVGRSQLGLNAVRSVNVARDSLSLADLVGADVHGSIHGDAGAVAANSCTTADLVAGGAKVGQAVLFTFIGSTPPPPGLVFEPLKVTSPDHISLRFCNPTGVASPAFSNVGVRVVMFG